MAWLQNKADISIQNLSTLKFDSRHVEILSIHRADDVSCFRLPVVYFILPIAYCLLPLEAAYCVNSHVIWQEYQTQKWNLSCDSEWQDWFTHVSRVATCLRSCKKRNAKNDPSPIITRSIYPGKMSKVTAST